MIFLVNKLLFLLLLRPHKTGRDQQRQLDAIQRKNIEI